MNFILINFWLLFFLFNNIFGDAQPLHLKSKKYGIFPSLLKVAVILLICIQLKGCIL